MLCVCCIYSLLLHCTSQAGASAPDVWLQLLERCASISSCQPALVRDLGLQLVQQRQQIQGMGLRDAELQQQVSSGQHIITQLQQEISGQQHIIQQLQQHDKKQAAETAELRGQVAELRGQVAQLMQALQHRE